MTKCRIHAFGLATVFAVAMGSGCAGPQRTIGPDESRPAPSAVASSLLECPGSELRYLEVDSRCGVSASQPGRLTSVTPYLSGYSLYNRTATDSADH